MEVERIPSPVCEKCGSYQVIITDEGQECDECSKFVNCEEDTSSSFGIDVSEDVEKLTVSRRLDR